MSHIRRADCKNAITSAKNKSCSVKLKTEFREIGYTNSITNRTFNHLALIRDEVPHKEKYEGKNYQFFSLYIEH
jgi:hypothetical protein